MKERMYEVYLSGADHKIVGTTRATSSRDAIKKVRASSKKFYAYDDCRARLKRSMRRMKG